MFQINLTNIKDWKILLTVLSSMVKDTVILVTEKGLHISGMDQGRVIMFRLQVMRKDFKSYRIDTQSSYQLGLNLTDLLKIIRCANTDDHVDLIFSDDCKTSLQILITHTDIKKTQMFSLTLISVDRDAVPYNLLMQGLIMNSIELKSEFLIEALNNASLFDESINMSLGKEDGLTIQSYSSGAEYIYILNPDEFNWTKLNGTIKATFTIDRLIGILRVASIQNICKMELGLDTAMRLSFKLYLESDIIFFIAARMTESSDLKDDDETSMELDDVEDESIELKKTKRKNKKQEKELTI